MSRAPVGAAPAPTGARAIPATPAPAGGVRAGPSRPARSPSPSRGSIRLELLGFAVAAALAVVAIGHLAASPRAWVLFYDGDSVLLAMIRGSLAAGQPQHWAMSAVLFLPETALFLAIAAVVPATKAALAANGVMNVLLLYVALRWVAAIGGRGAGRTRQIAGAVLAVAVLVGLSLLDSSRSWDASELPSLIGTTTYYSATLLALVVTPAIAIAAVTHVGRRRGWSLVALAAVAAGSMLTNPLFGGWVVVPLALALLVAAGRALIRWGEWASVLIALSIGSGIGLLLRIPFGSFIGRDTGGYAAPGMALRVLFGYYLRRTLERASTSAGSISVGADLLLIAVAVVVVIVGVRRRAPAAAALGAFAALTPPVVLIGAVALGTTAYRYLQPAYVAPLLAVALVPALLPPLRAPRLPALRRAARVMLGLLLAVASVLGAAHIAAAVTTQDPSVRCLDAWVTASHRTGAGRFFTIRGPKAYLADPRQLIQVNRSFDGYLWLVNRDDYRTKRVSFVVGDTTTPGPVAHPLAGAPAPTVVTCGRYTITDYHRAVLPIGPPTSAYDP